MFKIVYNIKVLNMNYINDLECCKRSIRENIINNIGTHL